MKRLLLLLLILAGAAFAPGCETTSARQSERAEVYASYRPVTDDVEIAVRYTITDR